MNPEEQMKAIIGAVNGKWHEKLGEAFKCFTCRVECVTYHPDEIGSFLASHSNPSPTDMNALMEYAKKLRYHVEADYAPCGHNQVSIHTDGKLSNKPAGQSVDQDTPADALRSALYQAVKEKSK